MNEEIKDFYNKNFKDWIENYQDLEGFRECLEYFVDNLKGKKILDVGCGPGDHCKFFFSKKLEPVGIDIAQSFIDLAKAKNPKIKFIQMDMEKLNFKNEEFDGLWVCASLLHLKKDRVPNTLREFNKVLKKSGLIYISLKKHKTKEKENRFFEYYSTEEISNLVKNSGFIIKEIKEDKKGWIDLFAKKL